MFEWLKKLFRRKKCVEKVYEKTGEVIKIKGYTVQVVREKLPTSQPKPEEGTLWTKDAYGWKQLEKAKEEQVKKEFLPKPQTHRRTTSHSYVSSAERHREAISKAMKGKASSQYLKTIKKSPKIKIEEED